MPLAHGGQAGVNLEALILALPMVVLGVVFFIQKSTKPIVPVVLVLGGIALAVASLTVFAGEDHEEEEAPEAGASYVGAVTALCEARRLAASDPDEVALVFQDEVHLPLHELAAEVQETDRAAAARLLQAKQTVEADVEDERVEPEDLEAHVNDLLEATVAGLAAIQVEAPTC